MQIINTSIEKFIVLNSIKSIENKHGYAIRFSGNKKLKRFATPANMRLEGTPKAVYFNNNDAFLRTVIEVQGKALGDFAMLEIAANNSDWYDVEHHSSYDRLSIWLGSLCPVLLLGIVVISLRLRKLWKERKMEKEGLGAVEEGKKKHKKLPKMMGGPKTNPTKELCDKKKAADSPKPVQQWKPSKTSKTPRTTKGKKSK